VTDAGIMQLIARIMTDEMFRSRFSENPEETMLESGYALTSEEIVALKTIDLDEFAVSVVRDKGPLTICHGRSGVAKE
jgi:hypothetical protein